MTESGVSTETTAYVAQTNQDGAANLPAAGPLYEEAQRMLLAVPDVPAVPSRDRKSQNMVWDFVGFDYVADTELDSGPPSVAAVLLRQGQLHPAGLFVVAQDRYRGVYQVRGYDLANLTIVSGASGLVVIDPLGSYETCRAALKCYRDKYEEGQSARPVTAVIYTQSGVDHYGGVRGLFADAGDQVPKDLKVYAPEGFLADAVLRQVTEGAHTARLIDYAYGTRLDIDPHGLVDSDLGRTVSVGDATFVAPTDTVGGLIPAATAQNQWPAWTGITWREGLYAIEIDGVKLVLQPSGGHASPAELNLYLPEVHLVHLAGPGLLGGPGRARAAFLDATLTAFADTAVTGSSAYGAPVWPNDESKDRVKQWITAHRDAAAVTPLPDAGAARALLATPGYAGTPTRTVREVWARISGTDLGVAQLAVTAKATLLAPGSATKAIDSAQHAYDSNDYAQTVLLLDPVISASSIPLAINSKTEQQARTLQANALTQLGYLTGHGRLRNALLTAARDVQNPGSILTRFPQTIADLAAAANPLT
ncbi:alkyl sulfatase dimerization domain-containing protein [Streptomyces sp. NPDC018352]|uniref:alkyl sulfatase dimerization domain-containing protein n=1 Tax=Streptomyces sp. NPDC018352 TaxID=3157194 RepID=UPI0033ECF518